MTQLGKPWCHRAGSLASHDSLTAIWSSFQKLFSSFSMGQITQLHLRSLPLLHSTLPSVRVLRSLCSSALGLCFHRAVWALRPHPKCNSGEVGRCGSFLLQCFLVFHFQPTTYPTDKAITFIVYLLSGRVAQWTTASLENQTAASVL